VNKIFKLHGYLEINKITVKLLDVMPNCKKFVLKLFRVSKVFFINEYFPTIE
jgi:hypothetical protein